MSNNRFRRFLTRSKLASPLVALMIANVALTLLVGCQSEGQPALSLEETKKVTATFEGQSFTPPPKTIADMTALLDARSALSRSRQIEI